LVSPQDFCFVAGKITDSGVNLCKGDLHVFEVICDRNAPFSIAKVNSERHKASNQSPFWTDHFGGQRKISSKFESSY
jgi:hypothetical protein